jgi:NitT/TauT family transport system ATP-binding protein
MPSGSAVGAAVAVRNARVSYPARGGALLALEAVTFTISPGEFVSIVGPSGCGKSTLLRVVAGLRTLDEGEVAVEGGRPAALHGTGGLGLVFQEPALLPWRTVEGNVRLPLQAGRGFRGDVGAAIGAVGLAEFEHYYPHQLSGGMQQRVALARALVHEPRLLLMDEPFGALDEITREEMRAELLRLWERDRKTVVFVTHSVHEAVLLSDRVLVMTGRPGRIRLSLPIGLARPRSPEMESGPEFQRHVRVLREALRQ